MIAESHAEPALVASRIGAKTVKALLGAQVVVRLLIKQGLHITTVESCTGGALASMITSIPRSSRVMQASFITYSNQAKIALGVPKETLARHTEYSLETATAMATAGLRKSVRADIDIDIGIGVTGTLTDAGPDTPQLASSNRVYLSIVCGNVIQEKTVEITESSRFEGKLSVVNNALAELRTILSRPQ